MSDCFKDYLASPTAERLRILFERTCKHLYHVARCWVDHELAEDVRQDVFLKIMEKRLRPKDVRSGLGLLTSYTDSIAETRLRSHLRDLERTEDIDAVPEPASPSGLGLDDLLDLRDAVQELPEPLRECVVLKFYDNLRLGEIAKRLGISKRTVQDRLLRAFRGLRARLGPRVFGAILAVLTSEKLARAISPGLERELDALVGRHPPGSVRPGSTPGKRSRWVFPLVASLFFSGVTFVILLTGSPGERGSLLTAPGARKPSIQEDAKALILAKARLDGLAWLNGFRGLLGSAGESILRALRGSTAAADRALEAGVEEPSLKIRVVHDDGALVRSGVLRVFAEDPDGSQEDLAPGETADVSGWKDLVLGRNLEESNPTELPLAAEDVGLSLEIVIEREGHAPARQRHEVQPGKNSVEITLPSPEKRVVKVLDAFTGNPVSGARVEVRPQAEEGGQRKEEATILAEEEAPGVYVVREAGAGKCGLMVSSAHAIPIVLDGVELAREEERVLWLHPGEEEREGSVLVRVLKPGGGPWAGIEVAGQVDGKTRSETTDERGFCRFENLAAGVQTIFLPGIEEAADDSLPPPPPSGGSILGGKRVRVVAGREAKVVLGALSEKETLAVKVVDPRGAPLPDVRVRIEGPRKAEGKTAKDGKALFESIPEGDYEVVLSRSGPPEWILEEDFPVEAGKRNELTVKLGSATIRGRVVSPVPGLFVVARGGERQAYLRVEGDGSFEFPDALPGKTTIWTQGETPGFARIASVPVEVPGVGDPREIEIRLDDLALLRVEVAGTDGRPVPGAQVSSQGPGGEAPFLRRSRGARAAELSALLEPGWHTVRVTAPGRPALERLVKLSPGEEERVEIMVPE